MKNPTFVLLGGTVIAWFLLTPVVTASDSPTMEQHMQIQANLAKDPDLAKMPSIRIDSVLANVPLDDRLNADGVYGRPFTESLRDGMSWCLAQRGMRVVTSGEDLRLTGTIEQYEGFKGWGHWGVAVNIAFKMFRGTERLHSINLHSLLKYSSDSEVQSQEEPKYSARSLTVSFPEVLFTRIGVDLCEKLIDALKERGPQLMGGPTVESMTTQRGSISIEATAANAEVRIDGQLVGTVPLANIPLPAGRHSIQVRKKGFKVWQEDFVILPDAVSHLTADLEPEPDSK